MNNLKSFNSLIIFTEIAKFKSFTLAAKHMGLSKSSVSQQLTKLEKEVGQQLIKRNTRGLSLTPAGEILFKKTEHLNGQITNALKELNDFEEEPSGVFALSFPFFLESFVIIPAITALSREFPKLKYKLIMTDQLMDLVENDLDASIFAGNLPDSNYKVQDVGTTTEHFYLSKNSVAKINGNTIEKSIRDLKWLSVPWQKDLVLTSTNGSKKKIQLEVFANCNNLMSSLHLAENDVGLVLLPDIVKERLQKNDKLVSVFEEYKGNTWKVKFLHSYNKDKPKYIDRFYQLAKYYFLKSQLA
ncbi:LysR family transcriptional regulator [Halobacteriovorax sp. HLS]|uniref:LysR family transcriptional regulator n=1 Tax=Halobacteriovorax sp. HLS TaxID=2234000 RepID=UPI000FD75341|nr:LysR family transcriptional regulator [Halobacteriovorax sp. HLS]